MLRRQAVVRAVDAVAEAAEGLAAEDEELLALDRAEAGRTCDQGTMTCCSIPPCLSSSTHKPTYLLV